MEKSRRRDQRCCENLWQSDMISTLLVAKNGPVAASMCARTNTKQPQSLGKTRSRDEQPSVELVAWANPKTWVDLPSFSSDNSSPSQLSAKQLHRCVCGPCTNSPSPSTSICASPTTLSLLLTCSLIVSPSPLESFSTVLRFRTFVQSPAVYLNTTRLELPTTETLSFLFHDIVPFLRSSTGNIFFLPHAVLDSLCLLLHRFFFLPLLLDPPTLAFLLL